MSGGGVKGFSHPGALLVLKKAGYLDHVEIFAGASAGGFVAALCNLGMDPYEILDLMDEADFEDLLDRINISRLLTERHALDDGWMEDYLCKVLSKKGIDENITLSSLYKITNKSLILTTGCRETKRLVALHHCSHPDLRLVDALKLTSRVPAIFPNPQIDGKTYWDGGLFDNYPVSWFPLDQVLGIRLGKRDAPSSKIPSVRGETLGDNVFSVMGVDISGLCSETTDLLYVMMDELERIRLRGLCYREICIDTKDYGTFSLKVGTMQKQDMFLSGISCAIEFLKDPSPKIHVPFDQVDLSIHGLLCDLQQNNNAY